MPFITQGKTNLRYILILIVVILTAIAGGGILYERWQVAKQESLSPQNSEILTKKDLLKMKYKGEERSLPPKGFLVPQIDSVPSQFKLEWTYFTDDVSHYNYGSYEPISSWLNIVEDRNENYEDYTKKHLESINENFVYKIEKEFSYFGSKGMVVLYYFKGKATSERHLWFNREGHLFRIMITGGEFSAVENLINLLYSLKPAP